MSSTLCPWVVFCLAEWKDVVPTLSPPQPLTSSWRGLSTDRSELLRPGTRPSWSVRLEGDPSQPGEEGGGGGGGGRLSRHLTTGQGGTCVPPALLLPTVCGQMGPPTNSLTLPWTQVQWCWLTAECWWNSIYSNEDLTVMFYWPSPNWFIWF